MYTSVSITFQRGARLMACVAAAALSCAAQTPALTTLYSFTGGANGANPSGGVVIGGNSGLFGTTPYGGTAGYGTIYEVTLGATDTQTVLYSFQGSPADGANPVTSLIKGSTGLFYGTTSAGGSTGNGTIFELTPPAKKGGAWTETVLYSFQAPAGGTVKVAGTVVTLSSGTPFVTGAPWAGASIYIGLTQYTIASVSSPTSLTLTTSAGTESAANYIMNSAPAGPWAGWSDGSSPQGTLLLLNGSLYGTTFGGGSGGAGAVFELSPPAGGTGPWTEQIIWNVGTGGAKNGADPASGLITSNGDLYGNTCCGTVGGMVFKLTPPAQAGKPWTERTIFSFASYAAGKEPVGGMAIDANGVLYGTTKEGGKYGQGILFSLTPAAAGQPYTFTDIWSFTNGGDGGAPYGTLLLGSSGQLYATVTSGCAYSVGGVLEFTPPASQGGAWTETVLYNFTGGADGSQPFAGVILGGNNHLYGTTVFSNLDLGYGTVYQLTQ